jgi:hypothetical protein
MLKTGCHGEPAETMVGWPTHASFDRLPMTCCLTVLSFRTNLRRLWVGVRRNLIRFTYRAYKIFSLAIACHNPLKKLFSFALPQSLPLLYRNDMVVLTSSIPFKSRRDFITQIERGFNHYLVNPLKLCIRHQYLRHFNAILGLVIL